MGACPRLPCAKALLCCLLWVLSFSGPAFPLRGATLVGTPAATAIAPGQIWIEWETDVECGSWVHFGSSPRELGHKAEGPLGVKHRVVLTNLPPGERIHYSVGTSRQRLATNFFPLGTAPGGSGSRATANAPAAATPAPFPPSNRGSAQGAGPAPTRASPKRPPTRAIWGAMGSLQDHFERHGPDFASKDPDDYAGQAWEFRERARQAGLPAKVDEDGVVRLFDPRTRAFAAFNRDGTAKTYFKPQNGAYFERQPGRLVDFKKWSWPGER